VQQRCNVRGSVRGDIQTAHLCRHQLAPQRCCVSDCRLLRLIALGLGLDAAFFDASFSAATSNVRVIHYLPGEHSAADGIFGVGGSRFCNSQGSCPLVSTRYPMHTLSLTACLANDQNLTDLVNYEDACEVGRLVHQQSPNVAAVCRTGPHTDWGMLTVLATDATPGLQIRHGGAWIDVAPRPGAFVVNIGDLLHRWSGGRFK
jgi:isopenicillin N synthase-like dioxygenase